jgi:hypothetical protein
LQQCRLRTLAKTRDFHLADRALHAQRQLVVREPRPIRGFAVDQRRAHDAARLQQRMPIAAIARQPRRFNAKSYYQAEVNLEDLSEPGEAAIQTF